ncbi:aldo/keto reductase [Actinoplanes sp. NPDC051851]|uniref:aldo/keto reductase n=1 Tax=Actinoplanes sp. NPDC051851 TaxID=3154753 RepID=UPI00344A9075
MTQPIQRLVLGGPFGAETHEESALRLAHFAGLGGRQVETARSYHGGAAEAAVGAWTRANPGVLGIITKVGHDARGRDIALSRTAVRAEVQASLTCLATDTIDTLLLHCDDPAREVEEIAETLTGLIDAGYTRQVGASNWPADRLAELATAIARHGHRLVASYHFSLAVPDPVALRSLSADAAVRKVVDTHALPMLSWSAQARGYFAHDTSPAGSPFDTLESRARRDRCRDLAGDFGCTPEAVALAWALHHPRVRASVGPRTPEQLTRSLDALTLSLSPAQMRWLEHGIGERPPRTGTR